MKIVVVHQYYLEPGAPGGSRFNELARFWSERGHDVTVIAGTVNYATGEVPERYRGRWVTKVRDGNVTVYRCHVPATYGRSYLGRMWAFFGFTLSAATAALRVKMPDVVIATSPPLVAVIPGWVAAKLRLRPRPFVFEIRDLWPESAVTTGVLSERGILTRILYALERAACRSAQKINVLTPAFRESLIARGLAEDAKIAFIPNGADVSMFAPRPKDDEILDRFGWRAKFVVMYAGAHGRANALGQLVDAAGLLKHRPEILIACVGDGPERAKLEASARERKLDNIVFHGARPKDEMPRIVNSCDVGAAVLQNNPTFRTVYPNKVFDYMACQKPTLLAIDGVARSLVCDDAGAGVFAEPENAASIAEQILWLADHPEEAAAMGRRGREWVLANATREALSERYEQVLSEVAAR